MSSKRYTDEFKFEAVKQVTERVEVAQRFGVTTHSPMPRRKAFQCIEEGANQATYLSKSGNGHHRRVRLHRNILQPDSSARSPCSSH